MGLTNSKAHIVADLKPTLTSEHAKIRYMARKLLVLTVGLLTIIAIFSILHTENAAASPLRPCETPGVKGHVLCGTLEVFEDRVAGEGRKIPLNVMVLTSAYRKSEPDPLFIFGGGPGQAVTDYAARMSRLLSGVRKNRDIVLVDQRGTGKSNGLECDNLINRERLDVLLAEEMPDEAIARCRSKLERQADLSLYATPIAMDDIDDVREWLGYDKVNLYGVSYGTRAALEYLRRHPDRVRTITLRGVHYENIVFTSRDSQEALDRIFDDCAKQAECGEAYPELAEEFRTLLDRLEETPAEIRVRARDGSRTEVELTRAMFAGAVRQSLYTSGSQRDLPYIIHSASQDDFKPLSRALEQHLAIFDSISFGMLLSVHCPEAIAHVPMDRIDAETANTFMGGDFLRKAVDACTLWPSSTLPDNYFDPVASETPALIISGALDPVTPPRWGDAAAEHLPNSAHIVLEGLAHDSPPPCALDAIAKFIEEGDGTGLGSVCDGKTERAEFRVR